MMKLLDKGYWVTIDYPHAMHEQVKKNFKTVWTHEKFIPFCSVIFPNSEGDDNLCIKVDDTDFKATNPGVWVYYASELKDRKKFTSWDEYGKDQPIILDKEH